MTKLHLTSGQTIEVDSHLYPVLAGYKWRKDPKGESVKRSYWENGRTRTEMLANVIMGEAPQSGEVWQHIDGDWRNFRRDNLRAVSRAHHLAEGARANLEKARAVKEKQGAMKPVGVTGYRGVHKYLGKFRAVATVDGKQKFLGVRATPEEAAVLYDLEMVRQGKSAINFPEEVPAF